MHTRLALLIATVLVVPTVGYCADEGEDTRWLPAGAIVSESESFSYVPDPDPDRVKLILFATISPAYLAEKAEVFVRNGIHGVMMNGIMGGWKADIWKQPTGYTPDTPPGRIVGEQNPLLQLCKRMNDRCRAAGMNYNSIKVSFGKPVPDWFDDDEWGRMAERFRQCAIFARDGGFAGVSLDVEYIYPVYELEYPAYQVEGYPRCGMS